MLTGDLIELKDRILRMGFIVLEPKMSEGKEATWLYYTDGKGIGYIQRGFYKGAYRISTVHKPSEKHGTGSRIYTDIALVRIDKDILKIGLSPFYHKPSTVSPEWYFNMYDFIKEEYNRHKEYETYSPKV